MVIMSVSIDVKYWILVMGKNKRSYIRIVIISILMISSFFGGEVLSDIKHPSRNKCEKRILTELNEISLLDLDLYHYNVKRNMPFALYLADCYNNSIACFVVYCYLMDTYHNGETCDLPWLVSDLADYYYARYKEDEKYW